MTLFRTFSVVSLGMTTPPLPISARVSLGAGWKTCPVLTHWFPFFLPGNLPGTPLLTLQVSGLTSSLGHLEQLSVPLWAHFPYP